MATWLYVGWVVALVAGCEQRTEQQATAETQLAESSGFVHYDWLPQNLRDTMQQLTDTHTDRHFNFYYYFDVDDINRHYYLEDIGLAVVAKQPVTHQRALQFIEDRLYDPKVRQRGSYIAIDTTNRGVERKARQKYYRNYIHYLLPEYRADFQLLRVALVEDTTGATRQPESSDTNAYVPDQPARPVRGMEYFRRAVLEEVQSANSLILQDSGTVTLEFSVWGGKAQSPTLVQGFSTQSDAYEAYQTDGAFIKAVNRAKVRWHHARKNGRPVRSTVRIAFDVRQLKPLSSLL